MSLSCAALSVSLLPPRERGRKGLFTVRVCFTFNHQEAPHKRTKPGNPLLITSLAGKVRTFPSPTHENAVLKSYPFSQKGGSGVGTYRSARTIAEICEESNKENGSKDKELHSLDIVVGRRLAAAVE